MGTPGDEYDSEAAQVSRLVWAAAVDLEDAQKVTYEVLTHYLGAEVESHVVVAVADVAWRRTLEIREDGLVA